MTPRGLQATAPLVTRATRPSRRRASRTEPTSVAFRFGLAAVVLHFLVSANLLQFVGIDYASPGGSPLLKLHPGTYLAAFGALSVLMGGARRSDWVGKLFGEHLALLTFVILILDCALYSMISVGFSGSAVYADSFLSAGLLAIALESGSERERRILGYMVLGLILLSAGIAIIESLTETHLIPLYINGHLMDDAMETDFRGAGLYDHPLTGAMVTSMGVFLLLAMRLRPWFTVIAFTMLMVGLLAFGGRAAIIVTPLLLIVPALFIVCRGLVVRHLSAPVLGAFLSGLLVLVPLLVLLATQTAVGHRLVDHLYFDDSAQVRDVGWRVLNYLSLRDVLFGIPPGKLEILKVQIGLGSGYNDIENCWLLIFLNLGVIGFSVFVAALALFFWHLGRGTGPVGWLLLSATILIASSSNSLGQKTDDLIYLTACMVALPAFRQVSKPAEAPAKTRFARPEPRGRGLNLRPVYSGAARSLVAVPLVRQTFSLLGGNNAR